MYLHARHTTYLLCSSQRINAPGGAPSPLGFLFDELALAIRGNQVAPIVKNWVQERYQELLEEGFMGDFEEREDEETAPESEPHSNMSSPVARAYVVNGSALSPKSEVRVEGMDKVLGGEVNNS